MSGHSNLFRPTSLTIRLCVVAGVLGLHFGLQNGRQWLEKHRHGPNGSGRVVYPERVTNYPERVTNYPERTNPYERPAAHPGAGAASAVDTLTSVVTTVGVIVTAAAVGVALWVVATLVVRRKATSDPRAIAESDPWLRNKIRERDAALQKWIGAPECRNAEAPAQTPAEKPATPSPHS